MPPVRTSDSRASKACTQCRRAKTRCYPGSTSSTTCLRCRTLSISCSLHSHEPVTASGALQGHDACKNRHTVVEERILQLEQTVQKLSGLIETQTRDNARPLPPPAIQTLAPGNHQSTAAPLLDIRNAALETTGSQQMLPDDREPELCLADVLSPNEADNLIRLFRANYNRWICLDEPAGGDDQPSQNSKTLLLAVCYLIASRHATSTNGAVVAEKLFGRVRRILADKLLHAPQGIEFFQAVVLTSLWPTSAGRLPLSVDPYLLTGFALQHSSAIDIFVPPSAGRAKSDDNGPSRGRQLQRHLYLSHLHACISMRRRSMVWLTDIFPEEAMPDSYRTDFEGRIVAEIYLYWTIHENLTPSGLNLARSQESLRAWRLAWRTTLSSPRAQFLEIGFKFAQLLMYEQSLSNRSVSVRESLIHEMSNLCSDILNLAMDTTDERTQYLTDHVYHMITFAALTLCRLISRYDGQNLGNTGKNCDMDALIMSSVRWLRTLGPPQHIGPLMSNVIESLHKNLRPSEHELITQQPIMTATETFMPEFLGVDQTGAAFDNDFLDWQSWTSEEIRNL